MVPKRVSSVSSCSQNVYKQVCTETMRVDHSIHCHRLLADQYIQSHTVYNVDSMFIPKQDINRHNFNTGAPGHVDNCVGEDIYGKYWGHHTTSFNDTRESQFANIGGILNTFKDHECALFIYLGFYVAFNTVQAISRRVVGRAEETRVR